MSPFRRRWWLNLLMLAMVLGLVGLVLWEHRQTPETPDQRLLPLTGEMIRELRIERPGHAAIVLQRQGDAQWYLREPLHYPAHDFRIQSLLRVAELRSQGQFTAPPDGLASYRLDPPQVSLIVNATHRLDFGGQTPLDHRRYLRLDNTIHTVPDTLFYHLIGDLHGLLAHRLLPEEARIQFLELPALRIALEDGRWQVEPEQALASADAIQTLLDAWSHPGIVRVRPYQGQTGTPVRVGLHGGEELAFLFVESGMESGMGSGMGSSMGSGDGPVLARPDLDIEFLLSEASAQALLHP